MSKTDLYRIELSGLSQGDHDFSYHLDDDFFKNLDGSTIQNGDVDVTLRLKRTSASFDLDFSFEGMVEIECDRCLDPMDQEIEAEEKLVIKFGPEFEELSDEVLIVSEKEPIVDLSWYMYELIMLNIPIKHVHEEGECNPEMIEKLKLYQTHNSSDEDEYYASDNSADPRWDALKNLNLKN